MASSVPDSYGLIARLVERNASVCSGMMELYDLCKSTFPGVTLDLREFEPIGWSWQEISAWAQGIDSAGAWATCGIPVNAWIFEIVELAGPEGSTIPAIQVVGAQCANYWANAENRDLAMFAPDNYQIAPVALTRLWQMIDQLTDQNAHTEFEYALPLGYIALTVSALMQKQTLSMFHDRHVYAAWSGADAVLIQPKGAVLERPQRCAEEMKRISALAAADAEEFLERFLRQHSD